MAVYYSTAQMVKAVEYIVLYSDIFSVCKCFQQVFTRPYQNNNIRIPRSDRAHIST